MITPDELDDWVADSAQWIRDKQARDALFDRKPKAGRIISRKLKNADRHLNALLKELAGLQEQMRRGKRWHAYHDALRYVTKAKEHAGMVLGPLSDAKVMSQPDPVSRALKYQRMAVVMAHAVTEPGHPRKTRQIALRIMFAADLDEPSFDTITNWLREIRAEAAASEQRLLQARAAE